ncbi:hypothetical protein RRG08_050805 [Elysia crispata]|uniref:Uncharacterized protein n=1 Tax=Elysia crispata TaxID=231223 RepID=A0AAE0YGF0_9GAST|nr:hypothetical protein RRG08_050805 [Elysia crispata]
MEPADNVDLEAGRMNVNRALDLDKDDYFSGRGRQRHVDWSSREGQNYPAHRNQERLQPYQGSSSQSRGRGRRQQQWPSPTYTKN